MKGVIVYLTVAVALVAACTAPTDSADAGTSTASVQETAEPSPAAPTAAPDSVDQEPVAYVPSVQPGSVDSYNDLVANLAQIVPADLRNQVPWPDLRHANPIVAQTDIFDLWIWMLEHLTEPQLADIMAAPGSPSRENVVSVFGNLASQNVFQVRPAQQYEAFDHRVVTFESAGLPLWLARDVPDDAVVVYYSDSSGPVDVIDQDTGATLGQQPGVATRVWLSIMVPTDVGWLLWRDQLIEPSDPDLNVPDVPPPPGDDPARRAPEL